MTDKTSKQLLKEIIEEQKKQDDEKKSFNKDEQIEEYIALVERLYALLNETLLDFIKDGSIKEEREKIQISEDSLGTYKIDSLTLLINSKKIRFIPCGTMLIGSKGRVDVVGPYDIEKIVLVRKGVKSPKDLIKIEVIQPGDKPAEKIESQKPTIDDWEWKVIPNNGGLVRFEDLDQDTITSMISRMI